MDQQSSRHHAIVIGGSITGLLAARVLADHFEKVTVLEKDTLTDTPVPHKTVPQGYHQHIVLGKGIDLLDNWFPGIIAEIIAEGGGRVDAGADLAWFFHGAWRPRFTSGLYTLISARPYTEFHVKRRLLAGYTNVVIQDDRHVAGLLVNDDKTRINGIQLREPNGNVTSLTADLVVDAGGRGSQTPEWLENIGYTKPPEEEVEINVGYTTNLYPFPENFKEDWKVLAIYPEYPHSWRGGFLSKVQGNQLMVTLTGYFDDYAPTDEAGYVAFAASLPKPDIYNQIVHQQPIGPAKLYKVVKTRRRYYEQLASLPDGLVVVGDAVCVFNPVFGQGITVAACHVAELQQYLANAADNAKGFTLAFQRQLINHLDLPWMLTSVIDLSYPQTKGKRARGASVMSWGLKKMLGACSKDAHVQQVFLRVFHMYEGAAAMASPGFIFRVIWFMIKSAFLPKSSIMNTKTIPSHSGKDLSR
ncbi:FAD-dependent oxidoreductase [Chitinophaga nivalis]|uniref:FAD-binding domain-containing protein n=1 Tax=Chitinophaga nivalis TaxID=2991709 RepID=A0ABT3IH65_9BACT|nr:hypothetical protein [Chitinophaga nivalis]MCW3467023.1 hypothetical protein [Chitinophaga nivalis]MCW3483286.1 hypothetical protein [Chitinophaga nivalis]